MKQPGHGGEQPPSTLVRAKLLHSFPKKPEMPEDKERLRERTRRQRRDASQTRPLKRRLHLIAFRKVTPAGNREGPSSSQRNMIPQETATFGKQ